MNRLPAWAILLDWLLERGDVGLTVKEIVSTPRCGRNLGASYRQRVTQLRKMLGDDEAVKAKPVTVDGQVRTTYRLGFLYVEAAERLLDPVRVGLAAAKRSA